ncbi:sigma-70 family RNA polymerase sigma factor [Reticulibacter mediterranei]|nr:sigma-70 family RNA polymerase sigma factor [Reticulibacter mediterranei]
MTHLNENTPNTPRLSLDTKDDILVYSAQKKDNQSLEILYKKYEKAIFRYIYRLVYDEDIVYDLMQETYIRAFHHLGDIKDGANFKSWLFAIAKNVVREYKRQIKLRQLSTLSLQDEEVEQEILLASDNRQSNFERYVEEKEQIQTVINTLDEELRQLFQLYYIEDKKSSEIAGTLGVSEKTVARRINRVKEYFHRVYQEQQSSAESTVQLLDEKDKNTIQKEFIQNIDQLKEPYQTVMSLHYQQELSYQAIAHKLGRSVGTIKSQINRGKKFLHMA